MSAVDPNAEGRCWCGAIWWRDHRHFAVTPVEFGRRPRPVLTWTEKTLLVLAAVSLGVSIFFGCGCSTVKTCVEPLTAQAISDGAAVLVCAQTKPLATCEEAQLAVEEQQLSADTLVCAETAVAAAVNQAHTAGK